jgi:hypothetical protein
VVYLQSLLYQNLIHTRGKRQLAENFGLVLLKTADLKAVARRPGLPGIRKFAIIRGFPEYLRRNPTRGLTTEVFAASD